MHVAQQHFYASSLPVLIHLLAGSPAMTYLMAGLSVAFLAGLPAMTYLMAGNSTRPNKI
jgi:hypothetical protein